MRLPSPTHILLSIVACALLLPGCRRPVLELSPALAGQQLDDLARRSGLVLLAPPPKRREVLTGLVDELQTLTPLLQESSRQTTARVLRARLAWELEAPASANDSRPADDAASFARRLAAGGLNDTSMASLQARVLALLGLARARPQGAAPASVQPWASYPELTTGLPAWQLALQTALLREGWRTLGEARSAPRKDPQAQNEVPNPELLACASALVDLGLHGLGISRAQAASVLRGHTALDDTSIQRALDSIVAHPGLATVSVLGAQALAAGFETLRAEDPSWTLPRYGALVLMHSPLDEQGLQALLQQLLRTAQTRHTEDAQVGD
ncbi:MAG: hypothetical protein ABIJ09_22270 [Pseudomonadota bacterium]